MTYPQQFQPQYPQPYAPQQQIPQQYAGQPAQPAPTPQFGGQMPPTAAPRLGESGKGGGGAQAPAPRHLIGRTVIIEPIRIDETTTAKDQQGNVVSRPTAYYHLTVVDGGPLQYGDNRDHDISKQHGMTFEVQTPCRFTNVQSDRWGVVNEVRDTMARGELASVGVFQQGTKGNKPFLMTKCNRDLDGNERPDGAQRFEAATQVWNAVFAKTFVSPEPRSLVAPPAQQPQQVAYQPTAPAGYAQQGVYPTPPSAGPGYGQNPYGQPAPATQPAYNPTQQPTYAGVLPQPDAMAQLNAYQPTYAGVPPQVPTYDQSTYAAQYQQQPYQPPQSAPPAAQPSAFAQAAAPEMVQPNPAYETWLATLPPEQQAAMRAQAPQGPGF